VLRHCYSIWAVLTKSCTTLRVSTTGTTSLTQIIWDTIIITLSAQNKWPIFTHCVWKISASLSLVVNKICYVHYLLSHWGLLHFFCRGEDYQGKVYHCLPWWDVFTSLTMASSKCLLHTRALSLRGFPKCFTWYVCSLSPHVAYLDFCSTQGTSQAHTVVIITFRWAKIIVILLFSIAKICKCCFFNSNNIVSIFCILSQNFINNTHTRTVYHYNLLICMPYRFKLIV